MNIRFFIVKAIFQLRFRIKLLLPMTEGRIQNPVEPLRWSFKSLTIFAKSSILDVRLGSEYASVEYCWIQSQTLLMWCYVIVFVLILNVTKTVLIYKDFDLLDRTCWYSSLTALLSLDSFQNFFGANTLMHVNPLIL